VLRQRLLQTGWEGSSSHNSPKSALTTFTGDFISVSSPYTSYRERLTFLSTVFAIICYAYFPIVFALYPETSRRTLEDMDEIFIHNSKVFVFGDKSLTQRERPQLFIDAETRRIEDGAASEVGKGVLDAKDRQISSHVENMA
jgi:hypothetical protein